MNGSTQTLAAMAVFLEIRRNMGMAIATLEHDEWGVRYLAAVCPELPASALDVSRAIGASGLDGESRYDVWTVIKKFLTWAELYYQFPNPCSMLPAPPRLRKVRRVLSLREIRALLDATTSERDELLILVELDTGIRLEELANLTPEDVEEKALIIRDGKVGDRRVPASPEITARMLANAQDGVLWMGQRGRLTKSGVQEVFRRTFERAGIAGWKTGPHCLRHSFATWYIREGGSVAHLREIMGHKDIKSTMIYVSLAGVDVERDHLMYSPARTLGLITPSSPEGKPDVDQAEWTAAVPLSSEDYQVGLDPLGRGVRVRFVTRATVLVPETPVLLSLESRAELDRFIAALREQGDRLAAGDVARLAG